MDGLEVRSDGPEHAKIELVLAPGAGAPMQSAWMNGLVAELVAHGVRVWRFDFPYMRKRAALGRSTRPDPPAVLMATWKAILEQLGGPSRLAIGGKSMGGRIASMIADEVGARGLVCLGYPFHPAHQPERTRTSHLAELRTPTLIVQGTRDALGSREQVAGYRLSDAIAIHWIEDGDHSFKPRARSGRDAAAALAEAADAVAAFLSGLPL